MLIKLFLFLSLSLSCFGAVDFDGVDDGISFSAGNTFFADSTSWSYALKFKANSIAGTSYTDRVFNTFRTTTSSNILMHLVSSKLYIAYADETTSLRNTFIKSISTGVWYSVVVTYDGTDFNFYVDDDSPLTVTDGFTTWGDGVVSLGQSISNASTSPMDGYISEFSAWDAVLTEKEAKLLNNSNIRRIALQVQPSSLITYAPLDDYSDGTSLDGSTMSDLSGNGETGLCRDGSNNTGMDARSNALLSYPSGPIMLILDAVAGPPPSSATTSRIMLF